MERPDFHTDLRRLIEIHFSLDELRDLCARLDIDYDQLGEGLTKASRVLALVDYIARRGPLTDLINACRELRSYVDWPHAPDVVETPCPYKGLYAFQEEDAHLFFGRDETARQVITAVSQRPLTAVIGPSGSGKSSLVFAGVLPKLVGWTFVKFRPGKQPFYNLAAGLLEKLEPTMTGVDQLVETRKLAEALQSRVLPLTDVTTRLSIKGAKQSNVLLVADQFEELYTLTADEETRRCFLDQLLALLPSDAGKDSSTAHLVLTLRADFLSQVLSYRALADAIQDNAIMLGPMNRAELRQAIVEPAQVAQVTFEERLVDRILDDIAPADSQPEPGDLPLLEFALAQLWAQQRDRRLTHVGYEAIGQVRGALARHAEEVFASLTAEEQAQLPGVMVQLVHPGAGAADTRRLATRHDLGEEGWQLTQKLAGADARLVVTNRDETAGQETAELVHEALIQRWGRLRGWIDEYRAFRTWQDRLRAALAQWEASGQDIGALLHGTPRAEAEGWLTQRHDFLSQREQAYIKASIEERDRVLAQELQRQRRLRQALIVAISFLVVAIGAAMYGFLQKNLAERNFATMERRQRLSLAQSLTASSQVVFQDSLDSELAALIAIEAFRINVEESGDIYGYVDNSLRPLFDDAPFFSTTLYSGGVISLAFSPDGKTLAGVIGGEEILVWDKGSPEAAPLILSGHESTVWEIAFSPNERILASGSSDGTVRLWDLTALEEEPLVLRGHEGLVRSVAFSPDGQTLATGSSDQTVRLWNLVASDAEPVVLRGHNDEVHSVDFSPDGLILATGSSDQTIRLWDLRTLEANPLVLRGHEQFVGSVAFSPDGQTLASGSGDRTIRLWDMNIPEGKPLLLSGHESTVDSVTFSPDGDTLASGGRDRTIRLWNLDTLDVEPLILHAENFVKSVTFSPDGDTLASGSDSRLRIWNLNGSYAETLVLQDAFSIFSIAFSPDGKTIASGGGTEISLWDLRSPEEEPFVLRGHDPWVTFVAFSPDGQTLASGDAYGTIRLWNLQTRELESRILRKVDMFYIEGLAFDPKGNLLVSVSADGAIRLWNLQVPDSEPFILFDEQHNATRAVAFSPDGQKLAGGSDDGTIRLWDLNRPNVEPLFLKGHQYPIVAIAFSPDGQTLASSSFDGTIRIWDTKKPELEPFLLRGDLNSGGAIAFSPNGKILASRGNHDGSINLWDLQVLGTQPAVLRGHQNGVRSVAFSPDGRILASGSADGTIRLWKLLDDLIEIGCREVRRNLTWEEWQRYLRDEPYRQTCPNLPPHPSVPAEELSGR